MTRVLDIVEYVRSKNAGPFCLTVDIFCGSRQAFFQICKHLETTHIAKVFEIETKDIERFNITSLNVVKFSLPRPEIQGSVHDRDMHGASWSALIGEIFLD
tara:strand:+ start:1061 stop:1363 length:303 start_codon:yes stop_codon:yes gene_type:complete